VIGDSCVLWPNSFPLSDETTFENKAQQENVHKTKSIFMGAFPRPALLSLLHLRQQDTNNFRYSKGPSHSYAEEYSLSLALTSYIEKEKACVRG